MSKKQDIWERIERYKNITESGCWEWLGAYNRYGRIGNNRKTYLIHRLIMILLGRLDENSPLKVLHSCDNTKCFNPDHLFVGTQIDNLRDCKNKNRNQHGESHYKATITEETVRKIKIELRDNGKSTRWGEGKSAEQIAKELNTTPSIVRDIKHKQSWVFVSID